MLDMDKMRHGFCAALLLGSAAALAQALPAAVDAGPAMCAAPSVPGAGAVMSWSMLTGPLAVDYAPSGSADADPTQFEYLFGGTAEPLKPWPGAYGLTAAFALPVDKYVSLGFVSTAPYLGGAVATLYGQYAVAQVGNDAPLSLTISTACGDFGQLQPSTIVSGCVLDAAGVGGTLTWRAPAAGGDCRLDDGRQYFLNAINADISALGSPGGKATTTSNANCTGNACFMAITNGPGNWQSYVAGPGDAIFANSFDYGVDGGAPRADFSYTTTGPEFHFSDRSVDSGGLVGAWRWSFGDGAISSDRNPVHTYAAAGRYTVKLTATDLASGISAVVLRAVSVDNVPPTVSVDESGNHGTITLLAAASDDTGMAKVEFYIDGALKGTDTSEPYLLSFNSATLADGSHALVAKAHDLAGNIGTSSSRQFSVDNTPPTVATAESGSSGTITLTAVASDAIGVARVEFYIDDVLKGSTSYSPYSYTTDSRQLSNGSHNLVAKAYDAVGNVGTSNTFAFTTSNPDTTPPTVTATATPSGAAVILAATANDLNGIEHVEFYVDNVLKGADTTEPFAITIDAAALSSGGHTLVAKAYDPSHNVGTSYNVYFTYTPPPTPDNFTLTAPASVQLGAAFQVAWSVANASSCTGTATLDGSAISLPGWTTTTSSYSPRYVTASTMGTGATTSYVLSLTCSNASGSVTSKSATVVVQPQIQPMVSGMTGIITLSATINGASVTKVEFYVDNVLKGSDTTLPYSITLNAATLTTGEHALVAKAYVGTALVATSEPYVFYTYR